MATVSKTNRRVMVGALDFLQKQAVSQGVYREWDGWDPIRALRERLGMSDVEPIDEPGPEHFKE